MGQGWTSLRTMMAYSVATNRREAVASAKLRLGSTEALKWYRLDDGVMGGRSSTQHTTEGGALTFAGMLDTRGGGFTSVRADFAGGLKRNALRVRFRGDGKTYKVLLSNGQGGGPWSNNPSWQHDLPTKLGEEQSVVLPLAKFLPSFGGQRSRSHAGSLNPRDMAQVGFMLSLYLSDGSPNPEKTFVQKGTAAGFRLEILGVEET